MLTLQIKASGIDASGEAIQIDTPYQAKAQAFLIEAKQIEVIEILYLDAATQRPAINPVIKTVGSAQPLTILAKALSIAEQRRVEKIRDVCKRSQPPTVDRGAHLR